MTGPDEIGVAPGCGSRTRVGEGGADDLSAVAGSINTLDFTRITFDRRSRAIDVREVATTATR